MTDAVALIVEATFSKAVSMWEIGIRIMISPRDFDQMQVRTMIAVMAMKKGPRS